MCGEDGSIGFKRIGVLNGDWGVGSGEILVSYVRVVIPVKCGFLYPCVMRITWSVVSKTDFFCLCET